MAESLYRKAVGDGHQSVAAAIFWLKTRAHWSETMVVEHAVISPEPMTADQWAAQFCETAIDITPNAHAEPEPFRRATGETDAWAEAPQSRAIAVNPASITTDAEIQARIRERDDQLKTIIDGKPVGVRY